MTRYGILLRGVNVGGVNIRMADLAALLAETGFRAVRTVLASGNALVDADDPAPVVKQRTESALRDRFGYRAWVQVLGVDAIRRVVDDYPFERARAGWHDYVTFVDEPAVLDDLAAVPLDPALEQSARGDGVLYWTIPKGRTLESAQSRAQTTAARKPHVTTRNLNTLERMLR